MDSQYEMPVMSSRESRTYEVINKPTPSEKRSSNRCLISACVVGGVILLIISVTALVLSTTKREQSGQLLQNLTDQVSELMKKVHNSDSHLSEMETELASVKSELNQTEYSLNAQISSLHAKPVPANCSDGYLLNPYSNTCYSPMTLSMTWQEAKDYCEADGGYLATFETLESASWFLNQRKTEASWTGFFAWIGGQRSSDRIWKWNGRITGPITYSFWAPHEPNNLNSTESCLESSYAPDYRFNDAVCTSVARPFCEKT